MFKFLNRKRKRKGQSTLEYAILIIIIIGALLSIQIYIRRGIQGRLKSATDDIGDQFSPGNTNVTKKVVTNSVTSETFIAGVTRSELIGNEKTKTDVSSNILNVDFEFWGN